MGQLEEQWEEEMMTRTLRTWVGQAKGKERKEMHKTVASRHN